MSSKKLTKRVIQDIAGAINGELPSAFPQEVLKTISAAAYVTTFSDRVAFAETLQRNKEDIVATPDPTSRPTRRKKALRTEA